MDINTPHRQADSSIQATQIETPPSRYAYKSHKVVWTILIGLLIILMLYVVTMEILFLTGNSSLAQSSLFTSLSFWAVGLYVIVFLSLVAYIELKDVEKNEKYTKIPQKQTSLLKKIYLWLEIVLHQLDPGLSHEPVERRYSGINFRAKMVAYIIGISIMVALVYFILFIFIPNPK